MFELCLSYVWVMFELCLSYVWVMFELCFCRVWACEGGLFLEGLYFLLWASCIDFFIWLILLFLFKVDFERPVFYVFIKDSCLYDLVTYWLNDLLNYVTDSLNVVTKLLIVDTSLQTEGPTKN
uniref:hypothetical protein n=1 Tax=Cyathus jiayuguanensis TaxID=380660 RepID=UPI0023F0691C|nr:hypothetical protein P4C85_mgp27 [Cyathus jiayuguanensis]WDS46480.1 hypothetical protein [Cyathus jiayuguanensis]